MIVCILQNIIKIQCTDYSQMILPQIGLNNIMREIYLFNVLTVQMMTQTHEYN